MVDGVVRMLVEIEVQVCKHAKSFAPTLTTPLQVIFISTLSSHPCSFCCALLPTADFVYGDDLQAYLPILKCRHRQTVVTDFPSPMELQLFPASTGDATKIADTSS